MNIPAVIALLERGQPREALGMVHRRIALPEVFGWICPAPCERACRRRSYDTAIPICLLERHVAEAGTPEEPAPPRPTGRTVAVVGAGPAGLSAAFFLLRAGHRCDLFDALDQPGGALRFQVPEERLPRRVLDREIRRILERGVAFHPGTTLGEPVSELGGRFDAVVVATGASGPWTEAPREGLFVCANVGRPRPTRMAVQAGDHGRSAALAVNRYLLGQASPPQRFDSRLGRLSDEDLEEYVRTAGCSTQRENRSAPREGAPADWPAGLVPEDVVRATGRCLRCDCAAADACRLRGVADLVRPEAGAFRPRPASATPPFRRIREADGLGCEEGKCIRCGRCVQIAAERGAPLGMTFVGRGYGMRVLPTFGESVARALGTAADECVLMCPTGALFRRA